MSKQQLLKWLKELVAKAGTQKAFAHEIGISQQYLNDVLQGKREPGRKFLEALGLRKCVTYKGKLE